MSQLILPNGLWVPKDRIPTDDLILELQYEDGLCKDTSPTNATFYTSGGSLTYSSSGRVANCFQGNSCCVITTNSQLTSYFSNISINAYPVTFSFWIKYNSGTGVQIFCGGEDSNHRNTLIIATSGSVAGAIVLQGYGSSQSYLRVAGSFNNNNWRHLIVTVDTSRNAIFYCDGVLVGGPSPVALNQNGTATTYMSISGSGDGSYPLISGVFLDQFRIYSRILRAEERQALFVETCPR